MHPALPRKHEIFPGLRLGTYDGYQGAVWCLDVDWTTSKLIFGAADMTTNIWDVKFGTVIASIPAKSSVRTNFSYSRNQAAYSTDKAMRQNSELFVIDVRTADSSLAEHDPILHMPMLQSKITSMLWGPLYETIITGHNNGQISIRDIRKGGREINSVNDHTAGINDMQLNKDSTMFVTASKETSAKFLDSESLMCVCITSRMLLRSRERIQVAIKCLCREQMQSNPMEFLKEAAIMHSIEHENIVRLYGVMLATDPLMLVTELAHLRLLLECLEDAHELPHHTDAL